VESGKNLTPAGEISEVSETWKYLKIGPKWKGNQDQKEFRNDFENILNEFTNNPEIFSGCIEIDHLL